MNQYHWDLEDPVASIIAHHGIQGQKWGVRRFQNPDGSLTDEGRRRLGYDDNRVFKDEWKHDRVIAKGTKTTRVIKVDPDDYAMRAGDDEYYDDPKLVKKYREMALKDRDEKEKKYQDKYMSVIDKPIYEKQNRGDAFYLNWFGDSGWDYDEVVVDEFVAKKPLKVAAGEKVINEIIKNIGDQKLEAAYNTIDSLDKRTWAFGKDNPEGYYSNKSRLKNLTMEYTTNKELFNKVNSSLKKLGYDAVMDVNDSDSESPVIVFDSDKNFKKTSRTGGSEYYDKLVKETKARWTDSAKSKEYKKDLNDTGGEEYARKLARASGLDKGDNWKMYRDALAGDERAQAIIEEWERNKR